MTDVNYVTEENFQEEVIGADLPVLVDFTATWCQPCKMIEPIVKQLAGEWEGKVKVVKLDADQNPNIMMQYGVMGIPTLMLFKGGQIKERMTGFQPKESCRQKSPRMFKTKRAGHNRLFCLTSHAPLWYHSPR
ncbi:MAG: thioredoxin [Anaerolineales bacterium]|nr:thioredoxin [Anaerolineales bacterium]